MHALLANWLYRFHADERGTAQVEYVIVLVVVIIGAVVAAARLGVDLAGYYDVTELVTAAPLP
jgi:Flp pilus assembly pilin Flp